MRISQRKRQYSSIRPAWLIGKVQLRRLFVHDFEGQLAFEVVGGFVPDVELVSAGWQPFDRDAPVLSVIATQG